MTPSVASDDTRDAIASMLRVTTTGDEKTNVGDPNDLVTDVAAIGDPHDAVTVTHMVDEPESIVTFAEPLPNGDIAHASLTGSRPAVPGSTVEFTDGGSLPGADASFAPAPAAASEPWLVDAPAAEPARGGMLAGLLASRKRLVIAGVGVLLLGIVLVAVLAGGDSKQPTTSAARGKADKPETTDTVAKAAPPKDEPAPEPAPTPVEVGSAEPQAGSAEAPVVEPAAADGSAGSAAEPSAEPEPVAEPVKPTPAPKPAAKKVKRVAAKPAAKPAAKKPVAKTVTKTATKTTKPAVQKPGAKKPAWDPNSLLPPKKK